MGFGQAKYGFCLQYLITPQAQRERGKVIGCGVHIYYMFVDEKKNLNRTF